MAQAADHIWRRQLIAFCRVMLGPASLAVAQSRSGAVLIARQQHAGSRNAQAADRSRVTHGPAAAAVVQPCAGALLITCQRHAAVVLRRQLIAFSHVMLGPAAAAVAQSRSGAVLMARQQHAGSCNAQAADRILMCGLTLGPAALAVVQSCRRIADHMSAACRQSYCAGS